MSVTKPAPKPGDPCPACGDELVKQRIPSDAEYTASRDRENPIPLPPRTDSASPAQRGELGELYACRHCGYKTRVAPGAAAAANTPASAQPQPAAPAPAPASPAPAQE